MQADFPLMRARAEVFLSLKAEAAQSDGLRTPAFPSSAARRASGWVTYIGSNGARWRMEEKAMNPGLKSMMDFRLGDALLGRCSRRFFMGAEIPDGVFSSRSSHRITPLSELEKRLVAAACGARSGWNHLICHAARYAPHLSNYAGSAAGSRRLPPEVHGLGFRYDADDRWPIPNPTGLAGVMEGYCPPPFSDMRSAVEPLCEGKFGPGGPFNPGTPGHWKDSRRVRSAAQVHNEEFRECVALQAQNVFDTFGRFSATVPSIFVVLCLQAQHLDTEFCDRFYKPGSYLKTHAEHMERRHS